MKNSIAITLVFILLGISSMGQWIEQSTNFSLINRGIHSISIVDEDVVWATAYDHDDLNNYIQELTKTTDGGDTWVSSTINVGNMGVTISQITAVNKDTAWIAVAPNLLDHPRGIYKTINGGQNWMRQGCFNGEFGFPNVVHFWDKDNGVCQGDPVGYPTEEDPYKREFELYYTSDGGAVWILADINSISNPLNGEWGYTEKSAVAGNSIWFGTNC